LEEAYAEEQLTKNLYLARKDIARRPEHDIVTYPLSPHHIDLSLDLGSLHSSLQDGLQGLSSIDLLRISGDDSLAFEGDEQMIAEGNQVEILFQGVDVYDDRSPRLGIPQNEIHVLPRQQLPPLCSRVVLGPRKGKREIPLGIAIVAPRGEFELMGTGRATERKQEKSENQISKDGL